MRQIACGFLAFFALTSYGEAQGQRRMASSDANSAVRPGTTASVVGSYPWLLMNGTAPGNSAPAAATPAAGGAMVSVTTLKIPAAAMKELQVFQEQFAAGEIEEAAKHVEKAIHIYPQLAGLHHNLGLCFARLGQYDKAIAEFQSATELDGRLVQPRVSLAETYLIQGKYNEGEAAARGALQIDPMNMLARYFVARNMILAGHDTAEAMELLRKSRETFPEARLALANAYARQHATEDAVRELREYLEQPNVPEKDKAACAIEKLTKPEGNFNCATK
jgi:tetratricopeptide (TPR) repeat protein